MATITENGLTIEVDTKIQQLIEDGWAWRLEGAVGRLAANAITNGDAVLGTERQTDAYGNFIGSRYDVVPGTRGSVEYAHRIQTARRAAEHVECDRP